MPTIKETLFSLPDQWRLTPVKSKAAYFPAWTKNGINRNIIAEELDHSATGFGLITGELSGGIMAIDCDGHQPHTLFRTLLGDSIPITVAFTSGKDGRAQYLFQVTPIHWSDVRTRKQDTKDGMLEFRWSGCQSVLPPSLHPETGSYQWINSPTDFQVAMMPDSIIKYLKPDILAPPSNYRKEVSRSTGSENIPIERCLSRSHRAALEYGVAEGGRHTMAVSLSRDLIGTARRLSDLGIAYVGDPETMLLDYCSRCSPPLPDRERQQIWRSAKSGSFAPSINNDVAFQNCINSWMRQNQSLLLI